MTDRAALRRDAPAWVRTVVAAGVDWVQVRDRSLAAGALYAFVGEVLAAAREGAAARGGEATVLVNRRVDVALAAGVLCNGPSASAYGATFGDYDLYGDLDLFVTGFASDNSATRLFRNNGDETFTDVTDAIGLLDGVPPGLSGFSPRFADMDGDFYPEMLLVADFGTSRYFRNDRDGTFTDVTGSSGTGLEENGMGQTAGDFDVEMLGQLPLDARIREQTDSGKPTVVGAPDSAAAAAYRAAAIRMAAAQAVQGKDYAARFPKIVVEDS